MREKVSRASLALGLASILLVPSQAHAFGSAWTTIKKIFPPYHHTTSPPPQLPTSAISIVQDENDVLDRDTELPLPSGAKQPIGSITGYEMNTACPINDPAKCELPLYGPYDRDTDGWWDNVLEELYFARVNVIMAHGRGCLDLNSGDAGNGNMCPRVLRNLVAAIDRAGLRGTVKLGMFDDTGAYQGARNVVRGLPLSTKFDLGNQADAVEFFWDRNMKVWFDTIPRDLWYLSDGKPIVAFWSLSTVFFSNQRGNARALLATLKQKFVERYGVEPLFQVDETWLSLDPTITTAEAWSSNSWFGPPADHYTFKTWNSSTWEAGVPAFRDPDNYPGCGAGCREVARNHGTPFQQAFTDGESRGSKFFLLEGFTDVAESAGQYRSLAWDYPNLYLNIIREHADPDLSSLRFQAEAADEYGVNNYVNDAHVFRSDRANIAGNPDGPGWHVGNVSGGDSVLFKQVLFPQAQYRFTARIATDDPGAHLHLRVDGVDLPAVSAPADGWSSYNLIHLGTVQMNGQRHDVRIIFDTGPIDLDWFQARRK